MKINYNVTGSQRKELTLAIGEVIGQAPVYAGMPTAAYHMVGGYTVSKTGEFTAQGEVEDEMNARIIARLAELDYNGTVEDDGVNSAITDEADEEHFITEETQPETVETIETAEDIDTPSAAVDALIIEMPLTGFTPDKLDNLRRLITAKAPLLKVVLDVDCLPIEQTEDTLKFPWFSGEIDAERTAAYSTLISLLCKTALKKKRITSSEKEVSDNPKYAMRCFLLSLGFIGEEYKTVRRILLARLDGNSSWKSGRPDQSVDNAESDTAVSESGDCNE